MQAPTKSDAVFALHPGKKWAMQGDTLDWYETGITKPTDSEINAKLSELTTDYNNKEYQRKRAAEYPTVVDQLDDIYHNGIDAWKATIKTTKDKYPKP
jgi:hypothetical protein